MNKILTVALETSPIISAFEQSAADMKTQIAEVAPIGIGVMTAGLVITFGIKFFKRIVGKA